MGGKRLRYMKGFFLIAFLFALMSNNKLCNKQKKDGETLDVIKVGSVLSLAQPSGPPFVSDNVIYLSKYQDYYLLITRIRTFDGKISDGEGADTTNIDLVNEHSTYKFFLFRKKDKQGLQYWPGMGDSVRYLPVDSVLNAEIAFQMARLNAAPPCLDSISSLVSSQQIGDTLQKVYACKKQFASLCSSDTTFVYFTGNKNKIGFYFSEPMEKQTGKTIVKMKFIHHPQYPLKEGDNWQYFSEERKDTFFVVSNLNYLIKLYGQAN